MNISTTSDLWYDNLSIPTQNKWILINQYIGKLLSESTWTQLPDALLTPTEKSAWETYRETLANIPFAFSSPDDVVFPEQPAISALPPSASLLAARARRKAARTTAKAIPNWATWTQAEWQTYFDAQLSDAQVDLITTLAQAKIGMKRQNLVTQNLVKLVLAMRDYILSDLPD